MTSALILDFDGTLVTPSDLRKPMLFFALRSFGATDAAIRVVDEEWGASFPTLITRAVGNSCYDTFVEYYLSCMAEFNVSLLPGARDLLSVAHAARLPVYIVSSSDSRLVVADLERLGVSSYIERVFGAEESEHHKPDPRVFAPVNAALGQRHGFGLERVLFVGDSLDDLAASAAVGQFRAVLSGNVTREDFEAHGLPSERIHRGLSDVAHLLRSTTRSGFVDLP